MNPTELEAWLTLARSGGVRADELRDALDAGTSIEALAARCPSPARANARAEGVQVARWLEQPGAHLLTIADSRYPRRLASAGSPPLLIYVLGDPDLLDMPSLAIVGSRKPTAGGRDTAHSFARELAASGICIVSGLALGIDTAAHRGALAADGATVAVLGTGIDRVYPAVNRDLAAEIAGKGALISEFRLGAEARRDHFPRRNRIISGLTLGTLVVEAAERSGSLITARLAGDQGREIFAIPGSIHNPMAKGCHRLIREGAKLVESTRDIFVELDLTAPSTATEPAAATSIPRLDPEYVKLLDAMGFEPVDSDTLAARAGLTIGEVSSMLLILELDGVVEVLPGGRYARLHKGRQDP